MPRAIGELRRADVLELLLSRPERANALSRAALAELEHGLSKAQAPDVAAVLVTAAGSTFCSGADLTEVRQTPADHGAFVGMLCAWMRVMRGIEMCAQPVIAVVDGLAVAGGLELVLACDVVVATNGRAPGGAVDDVLGPADHRRACARVGTSTGDGRLCRA
jgi:enoyl-CoA hydratase/carnithine racemase